MTYRKVAAMLRLRPLAFVVVASLWSAAQAHWSDLAAADLVLEPSGIRMTLTVPTSLLGEADRDGDGALSAGELELSRTSLAAQLAAAVRIEDERGRAGALTLVEVANSSPAQLDIGPGSHSTLLLDHRWQAPPLEFELFYGLFLPDVPSASLVVTVMREGGVESFVLTPEVPRLSLAARGRAPLRQLRDFVLLGVEHILSGFDHLLFLLVLLLAGGSWRSLLRVLTAFTVAHSVTLSLAVLDVITLPPRLVESVIALSIAYVAVENLLRRGEALLRWRGVLTFGFGLVHGLGFAGILQEIEIPTSSLALSLLGFNLGVELGQLAATLGATLLFAALRRFTWTSPLPRLASIGAAALGLFWFVERIAPIF